MNESRVLEGTITSETKHFEESQAIIDRKLEKIKEE